MLRDLYWEVSRWIVISLAALAILCGLPFWLLMFGVIKVTDYTDKLMKRSK